MDKIQDELKQMLETLRTGLEVARNFRNPEGRRYAVIEGNQDCNRSCSYCDVPAHYDSERELTVEETNKTVDWLYDQGYRVLSYLGGESLAPAPFKTKEGKTFARHTLEVVQHAKNKGMLVNVTTNGDFISPKNPEVMEALQGAGLDSLTFSLHSFTKAGLDHLLAASRLAAEHKIIPTIQTVITSQTIDKLPRIAAKAAENGTLFSAGLVQTKGDGFAKEQDFSVIPTKEQQEKLFKALRALKSFGFVRNNRNYLRNAPDYYPNDWYCDAAKDTFIKIGAGGKVNVCSRVETGIRIEDIVTLDDQDWRENKRVGVANCGNCMYHCYYESENPDIIGDIPMIGVGIAIKSGNYALAKRWGQKAAELSKRQVPEVDWSLSLS